MLVRPDNDHVIAHLTDLRPDNAAAFEHALALALAGGSAVVSLHAAEPLEPERPMPEAASVLSRWGRDDAPAHTAHTHSCCEHPVDTLLSALDRLEPDMAVACIHRSGTLDRLLRGSVSAGVARNARLPVLFVHPAAPGIVDGRGRLRLRRVLVAAGDETTEACACRALAAFVDRFANEDPPEVLLLGVGPDAPPASHAPVALGDLSWRRFRDNGDVVTCVADFADAQAVDLIVMVSDGHDSVGDAIRGNTTERVLQRSDVPLLSLPRER